jgi:clan AA aspartic protease (TIGR02281 family)
LHPESRLPQYEDNTLAVVLTVMAVIAAIGGGFLYWYHSPKARDYTDVYVKLGIPQLPSTAQGEPKIQSRLDQLGREGCYREAIIGLSNSLIQLGYPREADTSLHNFIKRCGESDDLLVLRYQALSEASDFSAALHIVDELVKSDPADAQVRYWRGVTFEKLNDFEHALSDYINSVQLLGNPDTVSGKHFYDISLMYAKLGRYCDAITPIETFIAFDPAARRTTQTTKLIAEYAEKGNCDAYFARGVARMPLPGATGVRTLPVTINGIFGNFMLDTGATYVAVTPEFAAKARISTAGATQVPIKTVGGATVADLGYATRIAVGDAEARNVAVMVIRGAPDPFGNRLDGLLGMSFLARFNVRLSQNGIELTAIPLR